MINTFLILISFSTFLYSSQQILLVVADDFNTSKARLECYEGRDKTCGIIEVNIGKNGLGWGLGEKILSQNSSDPLKYEGDKKAPIGVFKLTDIYGYKTESNYKMPYLYTSENLICVDDSNSFFYNHIIEANGNEKSFEYMRRKDHQYKLGIVVQHNKNGLEKRGSCIFIHVKKSKDSPTAGCSAIELEELQKIVLWLDKKKNPILIQIPKSSSAEILKLYPELKSSQLLQKDED